MILKELLTSLSTSCWLLLLPFSNCIWIQHLYTTWWNSGQSFSSTAVMVVVVKHSHFSGDHFMWEPDPGHYYQLLLLSPSAGGVETFMLPGGKKVAKLPCLCFTHTLRLCSVMHSSCIITGFHDVADQCIALLPSLPFRSDLVMGCLLYFPYLQYSLLGLEPHLMGVAHTVSWCSASPGSNQDCDWSCEAQSSDLPALKIPVWSRARWYCCVRHQLIALGHCPGWGLCMLCWHLSNFREYCIKQERSSEKMSQWSPKTSLWCVTGLPCPKRVNAAVEINGKIQASLCFLSAHNKRGNFLPWLWQVSRSLLKCHRIKDVEQCSCGSTRYS